MALDKIFYNTLMNIFYAYDGAGPKNESEKKGVYALWENSFKNYPSIEFKKAAEKVTLTSEKGFYQRGTLIAAIRKEIHKSAYTENYEEFRKTIQKAMTEFNLSRQAQYEAFKQAEEYIKNKSALYYEIFFKRMDGFTDWLHCTDEQKFWESLKWTFKEVKDLVIELGYIPELNQKHITNTSDPFGLKTLENENAEKLEHITKNLLLMEKAA